MKHDEMKMNKEHKKHEKCEAHRGVKHDGAMNKDAHIEHISRIHEKGMKSGKNGVMKMATHEMKKGY